MNLEPKKLPFAPMYYTLKNTTVKYFWRKFKGGVQQKDLHLQNFSNRALKKAYLSNTSKKNMFNV